MKDPAMKATAKPPITQVTPKSINPSATSRVVEYCQENTYAKYKNVTMGTTGDIIKSIVPIVTVPYITPTVASPYKLAYFTVFSRLPY